MMTGRGDRLDLAGRRCYEGILDRFPALAQDRATGCGAVAIPDAYAGLKAAIEAARLVGLVATLPAPLRKGEPRPTC